MTNNPVEKYKIELTRNEIRTIQYVFSKMIDLNCESISEAREYVRIYDKLEKTLKRK